jgi:antibiotic biosynthesis monooxygenase (ABM) superfamily enzyme
VAEEAKNILVPLSLFLSVCFILNILHDKHISHVYSDRVFLYTSFRSVKLIFQTDIPHTSHITKAPPDWLYQKANTDSQKQTTFKHILLTLHLPRHDREL